MATPTTVSIAASECRAQSDPCLLGRRKPLGATAQESTAAPVHPDQGLLGPEPVNHYDGKGFVPFCPGTLVEYRIVQGSAYLWPNSEPYAQGIQDFHHCVNSWIAFAGQRLVQAGAPQLSLQGDGRHSPGTGNIANGLDEELRVVFLQCNGLQLVQRPGH